MSIRMQNIMADFGNTDYDSEDPFFTRKTTRRPELFESPIRTQDSVFADQSKGEKEHPAVSEAYNRLKSIFDSWHPETQATDRLSNLLDNVPQINEPSLARKFVAAGAGLGNVGAHFTRTGGGADASDRVKYAPYLQEMAEFKEKAGPFQAAAQNENQRNIQDRTLLTNLLAAQSQADRQEVLQRHNEDLARGVDEKNAIARKAAEAKADNDRQRTLIAQAAQSGAKVVVVNGHVVAYYPNNPNQAIDLGEYMNNTAIKLQEMRGDSALDVAKQQGVNQMGVQGAITGRTTTRPNKGMTPNEVAKDRINKAVQYAALHPELSGYIKVANGDVQLTEPTTDFWGNPPDPKLIEMYKQAVTDIFGNTQAPPSGTTITPGATVPVPGPPKGLAPANVPAPPAPGPVNPPLTKDDAVRQDFIKQQDYKNSVQGIREQIDVLTRQAAAVPPQLLGQIQRQIATLNKQLESKFENRTLPDGTMMRSPDGGKTAEYSYDGGKSWGPKR